MTEVEYKMRMSEAWEPVDDPGLVPHCVLNTVFAIWAVQGREDIREWGGGGRFRERFGKRFKTFKKSLGGGLGRCLGRKIWWIRRSRVEELGLRWCLFGPEGRRGILG
jgi:hypothetical protein